MTDDEEDVPPLEVKIVKEEKKPEEFVDDDGHWEHSVTKEEIEEIEDEN